ncbi:MAG: anthranilate synthase component I [Dehalococcoidia bacterium]|nr:anthranilate synthase component I [Dehalococcoidia bacterium]
MSKNKQNGTTAVSPGNTRRYTPSLDEVRRLAAEGNLVPIWREIVADLETPVSAFLKVSRGSYSFLLESVEGRQRTARYSFIGTEPDKIIISRKDNKTGSLNKVKAELRKYQQVPAFGLPPLSGGAVGYLAYETAERFEDLPSPSKDSLGLPEAVFMLSNTMLIFDHVTHKIIILSHAHIEDDVEKAYRKAARKIDEIEERIKGPLPLAVEHPAPLKTPEINSNFSQADFEKCVTRAKEYITAGEAIQVVLSQRLSVNTAAAPFDIYRALRTINPSPYMFFLHLGDFHVLGASPEILVRVDGDAVMTRPLAGTRPRGTDEIEDEALGRELLLDEKERAEHIMLVDLGRNDIGRISEPGSVEVSDLMEIERYSHVMHMVTHVQGKLKPDCTSFDALQACFPAGTVSGAPKIRAMQIIAELEPEQRGVYAGAAGYFSHNGNMDMAIAIRTMVVKDDTAYVQAGCGVVYDSVPEREYQECLNKARALLKAIEQAEDIYTSERR